MTSKPASSREVTRKSTSTVTPLLQADFDCDSDTVLCDTAIPIPLVIPVCDTDFLCDTVWCDTAIPIPLVIPACDFDFLCDTVWCDTAIPIPLVIPVCDFDFLCDTAFYVTSGSLNMKSQVECSQRHRRSCPLCLYYVTELNTNHFPICEKTKSRRSVEKSQQI